MKIRNKIFTPIKWHLVLEVWTDFEAEHDHFLIKKARPLTNFDKNSDTDDNNILEEGFKIFNSKKTLEDTLENYPSVSERTRSSGGIAPCRDSELRTNGGIVACRDDDDDSEGFPGIVAESPED